VERHLFDVSPATIRNDMAALEDVGLIHQPHTSAGRVPTDRGYRTFVDSLTQFKPLSAPERRAIESWLEGAMDLDDVILRAGRLLAQLTHQVAVVQYPSLNRTSLRHLELVPVGERHVLVVVITDTGRVEQWTIEVPPASTADIADLAHALNGALVGVAPSDVPARTQAVLDTVPRHMASFADAVAQLLLTGLSNMAEERLVMAGTANLARTTTDFVHTISPVLDALEEQVVLLRLFADMGEDLAVSIGEENQDDGLAEASVVTAAYGPGDGVARLGVIGPTRMDYPGTIVAVRAVARYLSRILGHGGQ